MDKVGTWVRVGSLAASFFFTALAESTSRPHARARARAWLAHRVVGPRASRGRGDECGRPPAGRHCDCEREPHTVAAAIHTPTPSSSSSPPTHNPTARLASPPPPLSQDDERCLRLLLQTPVTISPPVSISRKSRGHAARAVLSPRPASHCAFFLRGRWADPISCPGARFLSPDVDPTGSWEEGAPFFSLAKT